MNRSKILAAMLCCTLATSALAQTKDAPKQPATPKELPKDVKPAMPSGEGNPMDAWMKAATPGKMHDWMAKMAGTWNTTCKMMMPDMPTTESHGTMTSEMILGGRYLRSMFKGEMDFGGGKMPFEGVACMGYNNTTQKFESTWIDNMSSATMMMTGAADKEGKTLTMTGECMDPSTNKMAKSKEVTTWVNDNQYMMTFYKLDDAGKEMKTMEITYNRAGDAMKTLKDDINKKTKDMEDKIKKTMPPAEKK